jgi:hypothetical protein
MVALVAILPGSRVVTSCSSQPLPSGSLNGDSLSRESGLRYPQREDGIAKQPQKAKSGKSKPEWCGVRMVPGARSVPNVPRVFFNLRMPK